MEDISIKLFIKTSYFEIGGICKLPHFGVSLVVFEKYDYCKFIINMFQYSLHFVTEQFCILVSTIAHWYAGFELLSANLPASCK